MGFTSWGHEDPVHIFQEMNLAGGEPLSKHVKDVRRFPAFSNDSSETTLILLISRLHSRF